MQSTAPTPDSTALTETVAGLPAGVRSARARCHVSTAPSGDVAGPDLILIRYLRALHALPTVTAKFSNSSR